MRDVRRTEPQRLDIYIILPEDHPGGDPDAPVPQCPECNSPLDRDGRSLALREAIILPAVERARSGAAELGTEPLAEGA